MKKIEEIKSKLKIVTMPWKTHQLIVKHCRIKNLIAAVTLILPVCYFFPAEAQIAYKSRYCYYQDLTAIEKSLTDSSFLQTSLLLDTWRHKKTNTYLAYKAMHSLQNERIFIGNRLLKKTIKNGIYYEKFLQTLNLEDKISKKNKKLVSKIKSSLNQEFIYTLDSLHFRDQELRNLILEKKIRPSTKDSLQRLIILTDSQSRNWFVNQIRMDMAPTANFGFYSLMKMNTIILHITRDSTLSLENKTILEYCKLLLDLEKIGPVIYAYIIDNHLSFTMNMQRYGIKYTSFYGFLNPLEDVVNIDKIRSEIGLAPLNTFVKKEHLPPNYTPLNQDCN